jgi:hypothetical protein
MEYLAAHGAFADVPAEEVRAAMRKAYPLLFARKAGPRGDFAREAEALG